MNRIGSALAPVSNWLTTIPGVREFNAWLLGIDARRSLPRFASKSFAAWFDGRGEHWRSQWHTLATGGTSELKRVVFLDDCLTSHCEPGIGRAAVELLEATGHVVERAGLWCCGRPLISKGLVTEARALAARNVAALIDKVRGGAIVVGVEPSCVLTLVDEYPDLVPSDAAKVLRDATFLVDEVLARPEPLERLRERLAAHPGSNESGEILLHGHCQQKALRGTAATKRLLGAIPGAQVREVDSGCCGMAGAFGYEHRDISLAMGERSLFPAVRVAEGAVAAPGFSCRHQVLEGTGKAAVHPVELLAEKLGISPNVS